MSKEGGGYKKFYLLGTDYVYPRTTNKILRAMLLAKKVPADNIMEEYTPFHHQDYQTICGKIKKFAAGGGACVISTINGDSNVPFYKEFANQGLRAEDAPIMAFSVAEDELRGMDTSAVGRALGGVELLSERRYAAKQEVRRGFQGLLQEEQPAGRRQAGHGRSDRSRIFRCVYLEASRRKGRVRIEVDKVRKAVYGQQVSGAWR